VPAKRSGRCHADKLVAGRRSNGWPRWFVHDCDDPNYASKDGVLDEAAASLTSDDAVRRLLLDRIDGAYRLATFILRDRFAAEDAVQEAALLAWDRRRTLRNSQAVEGWFTRILVNVCRDELRRRARRPHVIAIDPPAGISVGQSTPGIDLATAIGRLTPDEQGLLALRYGREFTVPEIADLLGIPEGTAKSRLHSTIQHLRAAFDAEGRSEEATR
jgi:RNA polymerase sigma-70 factor (ECF subfamily)